MFIDKTDAILCQLLLANSRLSYRDLADKLNLSVTAIHKRIQSLIELGIIRKFTAKISLGALKAIHIMSFKPQASIPAYFTAFTFVLIFSLSNIGYGLITATVSKTSSAATGISFLFILPQLFLGTFVGASLSSATQLACRFVPSYYVTDALTSFFLRGAIITSSTILLDLFAVSASCLFILAFGIMLYAKYFKL
ncbi:MAG: winged helix-turn-helix transcriptional regulator [Candidatus Bathyarchaeia archaeon]